MADDYTPVMTPDAVERLAALLDRGVYPPGFGPPRTRRVVSAFEVIHSICPESLLSGRPRIVGGPAEVAEAAAVAARIYNDG